MISNLAIIDRVRIGYAILSGWATCEPFWCLQIYAKCPSIYAIYE